MPIERIELDLTDVEVPPDIAKLIQEADQGMDDYYDAGSNKGNPNIVPCDPTLFYKALAYVTKKDLPIGRVFCEWGSGFGYCGCLAAKLGYESYGIELDEKLVQYSRDFAEKRGLDVTYLETSYFPEGYSCYEGSGARELLRPDDTAGRDSGFHYMPHYEGMDQDTGEIDVFFVYPWPVEYEMFQELFDELSSDSAIFIVYYGDGEICAYRKRV